MARRLWRTSERQEDNGIQCILVSQGCRHKLHTPGDLKHEMFSLTVLEASCLKSRCWHSHIPYEGSGDNVSSSPSSWWLQAFLDLWLPNSNLRLHHHKPSFQVCLGHNSPFPSSYKDSSWTEEPP